MKENFQRKVAIICEAYCFQLREFSNDNSLGTKIDFEFTSESSPCSINDLEHMSEISFFVLCSNIPMHFLDDNLPTVLCKSNESVIRRNSRISGLFNEKWRSVAHLESSKKIRRIFPLPIVLVNGNFGR